MDDTNQEWIKRARKNVIRLLYQQAEKGSVPACKEFLAATESEFRMNESSCDITGLSQTLELIAIKKLQDAVKSNDQIPDCG